MNKNKIISLFIGLSLVLLTGCNLNEGGETIADNNNESNSNNVSEHVYLGDVNAQNEMVFMFDYECIYCYKWLDEVFPFLYEKWIDTGDLKFRTQPLSYLSDNSLYLMNIDQNIKDDYPEVYYEILFHITEQTLINEQMNINDVINKFDLDSDNILKESEVDLIKATEEYTKKYDLEHVPTIIVNDSKMTNSFDLDEIKENIKG